MLLVGLGIGTANYILNGGLNWIQWIVQSLPTSIIIGYTLVFIGFNKAWFTHYFKTKGKLYLFIFLAFFLAGALATEIEHMIRSLVFRTGPFQPLTAGKMYLFNGIISLILGFGFFQSGLSRSQNPKTPNNHVDIYDEPLNVVDDVTSVPVKQGESILLIPIANIAYFEAYDNYSFVHTLKGERKLCDYSLGFLEKRLHKKFPRVHRKYIVNENHIKKIKPHSNGRFLIVFHAGLPPITSSKSYSAVIRKLIKME